MITGICDVTTLNNEVKMPVLGFGTYLMTPDTARDAVAYALSLGYRHIDTAAAYNNEEGVGAGLKQSGVPRDEMFLTTKVWNYSQKYEQVMQSFQEQLTKLGTDYIDLYLIHWPKPTMFEAWRAMEELYKEGKIRAIGVSNFKPEHLEMLAQKSTIKPVVNQIEYHPQLLQLTTIPYCEQNDIRVTAWSPLGRGAVMDLDPIVAIAKKYGKSPAQAILRWDLQKGVATIPKTANPGRIKENAALFDFALTTDEVLAIDALNKCQRTGPDPDEVFLCNNGLM